MYEKEEDIVVPDICVEIHLQEDSEKLETWKISSIFCFISGRLVFKLLVYMFFVFYR